MKRIVVLYHGECPDGFGAAWAARKKFGKDAEYIPILHGYAPPKGLKGKDIYLLDITYSGKNLEKLLEENQVTTIDHHITSKKDVERAHQYYYSLDNSGAMLAWKFFHPDEKIPWLIRFIEMGDLWRFKMPKAEEIVTAIHAEPHDFKTWDAMARKLESASEREKFAKAGEAMLKYQDAVVAEMARNADEATFFGKKVGVVNCASEMLASEIGSALYQGRHVAGVIWRKNTDRIKVSLRSKGDVDVSKWAKKFGGGGHKYSAAFSLKPNSKLPWKYIK